VRRSRPLAVLDTFDAPTMAPCCDARTTSTVTPQALMLMNSRFILEQAEHFAERVRREAGEEPRAQVLRAWRLAFAGEPTPRQVDEALRFLIGQPDADSLRARGSEPAGHAQALATFCQALLSANGFLYLD